MPHARSIQNLKNLSAAARKILFTKINAYIASPADPVGKHQAHFAAAHGGVRFIPWHRSFLAGFDDWQRVVALAKGTELVPLAFWNPGDAIPAQFPFPGRNAIIPRSPLPANMASRAGLAAMPDVEDFAMTLENYHDPIHGRIGGIMVGASSPADPIFWVLHAFFDHIAGNWETINGDLRDGAGGPMSMP